MSMQLLIQIKHCEHLKKNYSLCQIHKVIQVHKHHITNYTTYTHSIPLYNNRFIIQHLKKTEYKIK